MRIGFSRFVEVYESMYVCLSVCLSVCVSVRKHISGTTHQFLSISLLLFLFIFYSWSWLSPYLAALRYVIFGFAECDFYEITIALFCRAAVEQLSV